MLSDSDYDHCCHSNLARALATELRVTPREVEHQIHDVLNWLHEGHSPYFMKASPVRARDFIEFFAEIDLLGALSACPGGDCTAAQPTRTMFLRVILSRSKFLHRIPPIRPIGTSRRRGDRMNRREFIALVGGATT